MRKMISGIGFCMLIFFLSCSFSFRYELSTLKERMKDLEAESEWIGKQVSTSPFRKNEKYIFESYDEESGTIKQQIYHLSSYSKNQIILQEETKDSETFLIKVKDDYLAVYQTKNNQLFETTNIPVTILPPEEQAEVLAGKEIVGTEELYSFLENYSS